MGAQAQDQGIVDWSVETRIAAEMTAQGETGNTLKILQDLVKILAEENVLDPPEHQPVIEFLHPDELKVREINIKIWIQFLDQRLYRNSIRPKFIYQHREANNWIEEEKSDERIALSLFDNEIRTSNVALWR